MAWTAPRTWVALEVVTAALLNTHVRDNFLETAPVVAAAANDLIFADAANSMGTKLALGNNQRWLFSDGSDPKWSYHSLLQASLTNDVAVVENTYEQWGTEKVTSTDAGSDSVRVHGIVTGYADVTGGANDQSYVSRVRVRISLDAEATWSNGKGTITQLVETSGHAQIGTTAQHRTTGSVTTSLSVQAQLYDTSGAGRTVGDISFENGFLVANIMPD